MKLVIESPTPSTHSGAAETNNDIPFELDILVEENTAMINIINITTVLVLLLLFFDSFRCVRVVELMFIVVMMVEC